jgi:hypothetical protein
MTEPFNYEDFKDEVQSAKLTLKSLSVELEDMLLRLRGMDLEEAACRFPHELHAAWSSVSEARSAILHLMQSQREAVDARQN